MSALSILKHVFPAPQYITLPNVGVDISDTSLKYVQFRKHYSADKNLELYHWGDIDIPKGYVDRGVINDIPKLTEVLKEVRDKTGTRYVRVSLPEERAYLFETSVKRGTPFKEVRGLIEFKLEENVPLSPRDSYFDYDIVSGDDDDDSLTVSVAVYSKDTINAYYNVCLDAGLTPISFEIEAQAIARASIGVGDKNTFMIVDFGKMRTGIGIVHKGVLMYTSTIDIGGQNLSVALKKVVGNLTEDEYSKIKNTEGLMHDKNGDIYNAISGTINDIKDELETRIQYWKTRAGVQDGAEIDKIILCGGSSNLAGLPEYLWRELSIPTERAEVWQNAFSLESFIPPITRRYSYSYATAVGLALKDYIIHD